MTESNDRTIPFDGVLIDVRTDGHVEQDTISYARQRLAPLLDHLSPPVQLARVRLLHSSDPACSQAGSARVDVELDGQVIHAHAEASSVDEAIDLVRDRLTDQIGHARSRRRSLRRRGVASGPGEWRHGDQPSSADD